MITEGTADGPDVAALTEFEHRAVERVRNALGRAWGREGFIVYTSDADHLIRLADRLAAVAAQRDQYAAQVAADALDEAATFIMTHGTYHNSADMESRIGWNQAHAAIADYLNGTAADLRAALRPDGES